MPSQYLFSNQCILIDIIRTEKHRFQNCRKYSDQYKGFLFLNYLLWLYENTQKVVKNILKKYFKSLCCFKDNTLYNFINYYGTLKRTTFVHIFFWIRIKWLSTSHLKAFPVINYYTIFHSLLHRQNSLTHLYGQACTLEEIN